MPVQRHNMSQEASVPFATIREEAGIPASAEIIDWRWEDNELTVEYNLPDK
jgi:hypothetical protein